MVQPQATPAPVQTADVPAAQPPAAPAPVHRKVVAMDPGDGCNACDPSFVQPDTRKLAALKAARAKLVK
jgi:hypothetical protein